MFKNTVFILSLVMLFTLISCDKDNNCDPAIESGIRGKWAWVESKGGFGGWTLTPASEHLTRSIEIDDFYFSEFVNDSLVNKQEYDLSISSKPLLGTEARTYIAFKDGREQAFVVDGDQLLLFDQCFDCYAHTYKKK